MKRFIFPLLLGILGTALSLGLGSWQLQRLQWKQTILDSVAARIAAPPVRVPADANAERDNYLHILTTGRLLAGEIHVLTGTLFLAVCLLRAKNGHFTQERHVGFEAAAWYWHFVDVVWLFLFAAVYILGG